MKINSIEINNFKTFQDAKAINIPDLAVFIGKNGSGKSSFFDIFHFLHDCLSGNVNSALAKRGGYHEVISRGHGGEDIRFVINFRQSPDNSLITYELSIGLNENNIPVVNNEVICIQYCKNSTPLKILNFSRGIGYAISRKLNQYEYIKLAQVKELQLESPDILAIKGLGQFKNFETIAIVQKMIDDWYVSDFRINVARERRDGKYGEQLTRTGGNLSVVTKFIHDNHPYIFNKIIEKMKHYIPEVKNIEAQETQDGYIVLRFQDEKFQNPFSTRFISDGTIKMFMYLVLLHDPNYHALLCIEEPEKHLYPILLAELSEEFQKYSIESQVFISTHSPQFLNNAPLSSVYCLDKKDGFTTIKRAIDIPLTKALYKAGDLPGSLWNQRILIK